LSSPTFLFPDIYARQYPEHVPTSKIEFPNTRSLIQSSLAF
jgi:hypothetical protein